jgi:methyltransferase (TIGR00027 family)
MRTRASTTAAWVAGWRGLGTLLGEGQIADDPFGVRFGGRWAATLEAAARVEPVRRALLGTRLVAHWAGYMQVRTRAIDDELLGFAAGGGRQVVILGAGYDCRAARFARELAGVRVLEVDHPATQARKREVLARAGAAPPVAYVPWDFETRAPGELPGALELDRAAPTLTIWEGVTMYLSEEAIEATFAALRGLGGAGSRVVFTYMERRLLERPPARARALRAIVAGLGEPFRFGWDPAALPGWLDARGHALVSDRTDAELAAALLPPPISGAVRGEGRHVAVATVKP